MIENDYDRKVTHAIAGMKNECPNAVRQSDVERRFDGASEPQSLASIANIHSADFGARTHTSPVTSMDVGLAIK